MHKEKKKKKKLQTGETGFFNYITNVLNKIGVSNVWTDQIEHDRNNLLEKPVIAKSILIRFNECFRKLHWHIFKTPIN